MVLLYLGLSLENDYPSPLKEKLNYCNADELRESKVGHDKYPLLLDSIRSFDFVEEIGFVSTCNRFEFFIFMADATSLNSKIKLLQKAIQEVNNSAVELQVLEDLEAKYHMLRTYCGLNSGLIGEDEITSQFEISFIQARHMNYLCERGMSLLSEARELRKIIDEQIYQSKVSYCNIAIKEALRQDSLENLQKIVVLGSGNTAFNSCSSLIQLGVDTSNITLLHRASSSSMQVTEFKDNKAFAGMNYLRSKHGYHVDKTSNFVADADLLVSSIDSKLPVIHFYKNYKVKILDFNSSASCTFEDGADLSLYTSSAQLDHLVRDFSNQRTQNPIFRAKLELAEDIISSRVFDQAEKLNTVDSLTVI